MIAITSKNDLLSAQSTPISLGGLLLLFCHKFPHYLIDLNSLITRNTWSARQLPTRDGF